MPEIKTSKEAAPPAAADIYPLDEFYAARGQTPGAIEPIDPARLPEPYRSLLVHKTDMTSTLEKFHGERLHIEVLQRRRSGDEYYREVVLVLDQAGKRVEFGAIKIMLNLFPAEAREEVLRERQPLGRILNGFNIPFSSHPAAWWRIPSDNYIDTALQLRGRHFLYGRRNSLRDAQERPLAEIVEILPP